MNNIEEIIASVSIRTRIYRIIIKQMFGSKVFIKEVGNNVLFSLREIK